MARLTRLGWTVAGPTTKQPPPAKEDLGENCLQMGETAVTVIPVQLGDDVWDGDLTLSSSSAKYAHDEYPNSLGTIYAAIT